MRIAARLAGVLLLTLGLAGCTTDKVLQLDSQIASITFKASGVDAFLYNVWDVIEDHNPDDGLPDAGTVPFLYCEVIPTTTGPRTQSVLSAPWPHSFRVSVLRAGETEFQPVTDPIYLDVLLNPSISPFDTSVRFSNNIPKADVTIMGRTFKWRNPRQLTALNADVVAATDIVNTLNQLEPMTYPFQDGLCSNATADIVALAQLAPLAGAAPPYTLELKKGDTLRVEARKSFNGLTGLGVNDPSLSGSLSIDGIPANDLIIGKSGTTDVPGDGLSFLYSSR